MTKYLHCNIQYSNMKTKRNEVDSQKNIYMLQGNSIDTISYSHFHHKHSARIRIGQIISYVQFLISFDSEVIINRKRYQGDKKKK